MPARDERRPRRRRIPLRTVLAAVLGGAALTGSVSAQVYRLGDDDEWAEVETVVPGTPEAQLETIRRAIAEREYQRAEFLASRWIEVHARHPRLPDAYLARADALRARGDLYESLFDYELIARRYPGSEAFITALEREFEIARRFLNGTKRKLGGLRFVDAREEGEELMIRIQERLPGSRLAERAAIELADYFFRERRMRLAADMYDIFLQNHPKSVDAEKARKRLIAADLAAFKGPQFDASGLLDARTRIRELMATSPASARELDATGLLVRIDESLAGKSLATAQWYARSGDPLSAEQVLARLMREHPQTIAAIEGARYALELMPRLPQRIRDERRGLYERMLGLVEDPTPPPAIGSTPDDPAADPVDASASTGDGAAATDGDGDDGENGSDTDG